MPNQFIGRGLTLPRIGRGRSLIITADTSPVLAALDDADTPAAGFTSGVYSSTAGTISSETAVYLVDGAQQLGTYDLTAGEVVQVREDVVDSAANEQSFFTASRIVQPSVALSNTAVPTIDQAIIGEVSTATTGTWAGSAARTYSYQWKVGGVDVGTDANTYTPQPADDGLDLTVTVIADDGFTQVPATSAATTVSEAVPILTTPTAAADGQNGVKTLSVITDTGDGTLVASTYPAADTPTAPAIELGTGAAITDSKTVTATGLQTFPAGTGLDPITPYKTWYVHRSAGGQLSEAVASATFYTDPGVYAAAGVADIQVNDGLDNPTVVVTVDGVEVFNGPVALLNLQADAYALVAPAIGVVGGGAPATDSTLEDLDEDVWTFDPAINPAPTPTLQWDSDGAPIGGATASTYAVQPAQSDTDMTLDKALLSVPATSNAIVIPAASFVPTDLVDLVAWYDPTDAASITESSGSVSQWDNQITGRNLIQGTAASQFITGVQTENSLNVMQSSGSNDCMIYTTNDVVYDNHEIWIICRPSALSKDLYGSSFVSDGHVLIQISGTNVSHKYWTSAGQQTVSGPSVSTSELMLVHCWVDGTEIGCGKNGSASTTTISGTKSGSGKQICVGARYNNYSGSFAGNIGDVVITDAALSLSDRNSLGNYLCDKYGLTWTTMT